MKKSILWKTGIILAATAVFAGCGRDEESGSSRGAESTVQESGAESAGAGADEAEGAESGGQLQAILDAGVLRIGTEGTYRPNSYHDENDELVGFDVEVGRKIAEKLGVEAEFMEADWASLLAAMDAGRIDTVINEVEYSEERALKYDFSQPYTYIHGAIMVRADYEDIKSFEDLDGKKAAQNKTSSWGDLAESYGAERVNASTVNECIDLLLTGRADATLNVETAFQDYMSSHPDAAVKVAVKSESASSSLVPVRKGNEDLLEAINKALDEMKASGELSEISMKYFGMDVTVE